MRNLRRELNDGKHLIGTWLNSGSPILAELMAACGFDFICVDAEHSAVDLPETQKLFQAIRSGNPNCAAVVRLHGIDYALVKRYLDAGARAVIGPLVNCAADAELLVQAAKYPPLGKRGVGFCRANQYGMTLQEEFARANDEILVAVQIEHVDGVKNIGEIVAVPGIDAVFIGPYDLTASMGITGRFDHPDYIAARDQILAACKRRHVHAGIHVIQPNPEEVLKRSQEGYRLIAYSLDITMVLKTCQTAFEIFKTGLPHE
jgi:2-dehydro-3-deoxyglucarate aldolase